MATRALSHRGCCAEKREAEAEARSVRKWVAEAREMAAVARELQDTPWAEEVEERGGQPVRGGRAFIFPHPILFSMENTYIVYGQYMNVQNNSTSPSYSRRKNHGWTRHGATSHASSRQEERRRVRLRAR